MAWDDDLYELFPNTVQIISPGATRNAHGRRVVGPPEETVQCLIEYKIRQVRNVKGENTSSSAAIYFPQGAVSFPDLPELADYVFVLPDDSRRPTVAVDRFYDEEGGTDNAYLHVVYLS